VPINRSAMAGMSSKLNKKEPHNYCPPACGPFLGRLTLSPTRMAAPLLGSTVDSWTGTGLGPRYLTQRNRTAQGDVQLIRSWADYAQTGYLNIAPASASYGASLSTVTTTFL
jgi:hypothetical protein